MGTIYYGSNACFLVRLRHPGAGQSLAVYKPARGEYPLWDFPAGSLHKREVATYVLDAQLGWGLVPPAVVATGPFGQGSLQLFVEEDVEASIPVDSLRRMVLLDLIANNADRKPDHLLVGHGGRLWGIDHGLTFHVEPKLRTVLWHFAGEPLNADELSDLRRLNQTLVAGAGGPVGQLISHDESRALVSRIKRIVTAGTFPDPQIKAVPYRW